MKNISYFEKVDSLIDQLFYEGTINDGTLLGEKTVTHIHRRSITQLVQLIQTTKN